MQNHDQIQRFLINGTAIRGELISLDASFKEVLSRVKVTGRAASILGESLAAICLLASTIKIDGKITLQIRGDGDLNMLVAQATSNRTIRGLIRGHIEIDDSRDLKEMFHSDHIVLSIETGNSKPHQGIVPLDGPDISSALKVYFAQSEQLPTQLWLVGNEESVSGLLLQKMPKSSNMKGNVLDKPKSSNMKGNVLDKPKSSNMKGNVLDKPKSSNMKDKVLDKAETKHVTKSDEPHDTDDDWVRVQVLADTIKDEELLELSSSDLLHRLFNQDDVQLFDAEPIRFDCSCSKKRTAAMIASVGKEDIDDLLTERDDVEIICEFCNKAYVFDRVDVAEIFATSS